MRRTGCDDGEDEADDVQLETRFSRPRSTAAKSSSRPRATSSTDRTYGASQHHGPSVSTPRSGVMSSASVARTAHSVDSLGVRLRVGQSTGQ